MSKSYTIDGDEVEYGFQGYTIDGDPIYSRPVTGDSQKDVINNILDRLEALETILREEALGNPTIKDALEKYQLVRKLSK